MRMTTHSIPIANLCASCEKGVFFKDDQKFLNEIDENGSVRLVKSEHTAITVTELVLLHKDTLPALPFLKESSKKGCDFCGFLQDMISAEDTQDEARRIFGSTFNDMKEPLNVSINIHFRWRNEIEGDCRGEGLLGALILLCFDDAESEITLLCLAEGVTGSEASNIWLNLKPPSSQLYAEKHRLDWVSKTFEDDVRCQKVQPSSKPFFPERLIHVQEKSQHLILRTNPSGFGTRSQTPPYAALSYCWGPPEDAKQQLKTTTTSITQRQKAITDDEMTEVLKDAVAVTRILKIPYLWVDALCILQDDISDWERQCVSVADLYANASVTICAASSTTCKQGFLQQRGPRIRIPFQSVRRPDISGSYVLQFKYAGFPRGLVFSEAAADAHHSRWGTRGWVFQEDSAASRKLLFGNSNIHYFSSSSVKSMGSSVDRQLAELGLSYIGSQTTEETYKSWSRIVREYSRYENNSFTKTKDMLPALSGLTSHYGAKLQDRFHAGLWKGDLFRGLMWYWEGGSETKARRECCTPALFMRHNDCPVPSWSPLGRGMFVTHGAVYRDDECLTSFQPEYQALEAHTEPAGTNPYGEIEKNWWLRLRSHVLDLGSLNQRRLQVEDTFDEPGSRGTLLYDGKHVGCFELDFSYDEYGDMYSDSGSNSPNSMLDEISRFSWVLLGSCKVRNAAEPQNRVRRARGACGLILYSAPSSDKFFRVGVFFPSFPERHHDGLMLIRRLGRVKTVNIV